MTNTHLAASTIGEIGRGRKDLTAELVMAFGMVLGIQAEDLLILAGLEPQESTLKESIVSRNVAYLIWDVRSLTVEQIRQVKEEAEVMVD